MADTPTCTCPEEHRGHMCELLAGNDLEGLAAASGAPRVQCLDCGAWADAGRYVCNPEELPE